MSTITWLHLSDLHFQESQKYDSNVVLKPLLKDIGERINEDSLKPDFIIISGDIANKGLPEEYSLACQFLDDLRKITFVPKEKIFIIPGNHDVDRAISPTIINSLRSHLSNRDLVNKLLSDKGELTAIINRFNNYHSFIKHYMGENSCLNTDNLFYINTVRIGSCDLALLGLNSAWISIEQEEQGKLLLGDRQIRDAIDATEGADFKIAIFHHPSEWLKDFDRTNAEALLHKNCDMILQGHMHRPGFSFNATPDSEAIIIAAGACYESRDYPNSYNFVKIDIEAKTGTIYLRRYSKEGSGFWTKDVETYRNVKDGIIPFNLPRSICDSMVSSDRIVVKSADGNELHKKEIDYRKYISSLYENLKDYLKWPITRFLGNDTRYILDLSLEKKSNHKIKSAKDVLGDRGPVIILGEPGSGKTYLLKYLAKEFIESPSSDDPLRIPIIIKAKYWGTKYKAFIDAIYNEISIFIPDITLEVVKTDLVAGKYVILIDGYDEIRKSKDEFAIEVERLACNKTVKIIMASREANYHGEFTTHFLEYKIEGISDEQIDAFGRDVASINIFSYYLRKKGLLELARLPLYLVMLCKLSMNNEAQIPNNKARIWEEFANFLLNEYPYHRNPAVNLNFSVSQKMNFLSKYARERFDDINFNDYVKCANEIGVIKDEDLLLKEIIDSGILIGDISRLDFIHYAANEFFYARLISTLKSEEIVAFIKGAHNQEQYFEIILFLVGLLRDQGKQEFVFNYLEENNIELYIKCINSRYHTDLSAQLDYSDLEYQYLFQLQKSYNALLDRYFGKIKSKFSPFCFLELDSPTLTPNKVKVKGSVDVINSKIFYEYTPVINNDKGIEPEILRITPGTLGSSITFENASPTQVMAATNDKQFYKDLDLGRLGLDSAREVAIEDISSRLKYLIDKKRFNMPSILACEQVIKEIHKVSSKAEAFQDRELEPIWKFENGVYEAQEYLQAFERIKDHPFIAFGTKKIPININDIIGLLEFIISRSISIPNSVLPQVNSFNGSSKEDLTSPTRYFLYNPDEIKIRLERMYTILPKIYYQTVDLNFPDLRSYLGHCRIYPFKYIVDFNVGNGILHEDYVIWRIYRLPVASEGDMTASVAQTDIETIKDDYFRIHEDYIKRLKTFGRFSEFNSDRFSIGASGFGDILDDRAITIGVYKLLKNDLENLFEK
jgi:predicted MPP superfamily phosphohydrolase